MLSGQSRHARDSFFFEGMVEIAAAQENHSATIERSAKLRKRFPGCVAGYTFAATACRLTNKLDEATALAASAVRTAPDTIHGYLELCRIAEALNDWPAAEQRWRLVRDKFDHF